jgi:hypothetical protein
MSVEDGVAVVRRNSEEVQSRGNFQVFDELFAADFVDHSNQCYLKSSRRRIP